MFDIDGYKVGGVVFSEEQLAKRVKELGAEISRDYKGKKLLVIGILRGAVMFFSDLVRAIDLDIEIDFMAASSYGNGTVSTGVISIKKEPDAILEGRDILLVEDIIDTGNTLKYLKDSYFRDKKVKSVKVCTLLDKPVRRTADIIPDYKGFEVDDRFIIGYGLDYQERFRQLPHITYLVPDEK